jgi:hypothetical protein
MSRHDAKRRLVLVTVGTTKFDLLIEAVDSLEFIQALITAHYSHLLVQHGHGEYRICNIQHGRMDGIDVQYACPLCSPPMQLFLISPGYVHDTAFRSVAL